MPFSQTHADAAANFYELVLRHTADEYWGKPFLLCPWQEDVITRVFGSLDESGNRLIEQVYLEVPKKAGKTEFAAGMVLLVLVTTKTPGCQVYGAAAATRQALNVYRAACKMVEQSALLSAELRLMRGTNRIVKRKDPDSFYAAIAADGDFGDGVNPSFVVADEVHRWKTRKQLENWDVLAKGGITRQQTLTVAITTAGVQNESPLAWKLHEKARKIDEGIVSDSRFYGKLYGADPDDDPGAPATWIKANPSLKENGGFLDSSKVAREYEAAVSEGDLTSFKRYFLNIWDQKEARAIQMHEWDASTGPWVARGLLEATPECEVRPLPHEHLKRFFGRRAYAGVDLSMTEDLTSVGFVFPCGDDVFDVLPFFWVPRDRLKALAVKLGVPLEQWERDGFLEVCPGRSIDYRAITARLKWGASMFDLQPIAFDPWNSREISNSLVDDGFPSFEVRQGYGSLNEPTKKILRLVSNGNLHHGGHPVLRWNANCLATVERNENLMFAKPERAKSASRIDGMAAIANAFCLALTDTQVSDCLPVVI